MSISFLRDIYQGESQKMLTLTILQINDLMQKKAMQQIKNSFPRKISEGQKF